MKTLTKKKIFSFIILLIISTFFLSNFTSSASQIDNPEYEQAAALLARMSPAERVGQLFIIGFDGVNVGPDRPIYKFIMNNHIGGVVLSSKKNNFQGQDNYSSNLWSLTNQLQTTKYLSSQKSYLDPETDSVFSPEYIPLFIAISQEGDGYPNDQFFSEISLLPSLMSIGATWDPSLSQDVGELMGKELSALGINIILGPSLDVIEAPKPEQLGDLNVRSFGGDPYWVSKLAEGYVKGLHQGSNNRLLVAGKHFPGLGNADRLPDDEIATVRKSLDQLRLVDLEPYFNLTGRAESVDSELDLILTSHIRFKGFQENIRASTLPLSLDQQTFQLLMNLEDLSSWRENGGLALSDNLASEAIIRFYTNLTDQAFNLQRIALDALLTGNDLLYIDDFSETEGSEGLDEITETIYFFNQKYNEDRIFASRVDDAVLRILMKKYKQYGTFNLINVLPDGTEISSIGENTEVTFDVASAGATLISPSVEELEINFPNPPGYNEQILIVSDSYTITQCEQYCDPVSVLEMESLKTILVKNYGPELGDQIQERNIYSHTSQELLDYLNDRNESDVFKKNINNAEWIIYLMLDVNPNRTESLAIKRFLSEFEDEFRDKKFIVFAMNAPYYLDATEITKLTAYYGLFGKTNQHIEVVSRILFKEIIVPEGSLPVSVPGAGYDLIVATLPDKDQIISLEIIGSEEDPETLATPIPIEESIYKYNQSIKLRTSVIYDNNGHPVPDNTEVQFVVNQGVNQFFLPAVLTEDGIANLNLVLTYSGLINITARCEEATSEPLHLEITPPITAIPIDSTETPTNVPLLEDTPVPTDLPTNSNIEPGNNLPTSNNLLIWTISLVLILSLGWVAYMTGKSTGQSIWGIRWGLSALIGGFIGFLYIALELPGTELVLTHLGRLGYVFSAFVGTGIGWGIASGIQLIARNFNSNLDRRVHTNKKTNDQ